MLNYSYTMTYVFLTALSMVFIHHAANFIPPALNLFLGTLIAILVFHALNIKQIKSIYIQAWQVKELWFKIMLTVAGMWLATIYGPAYLTPNIFILILFSCTSILGSLISYKNERQSFLLIAAAGILICTLLILTIFLKNTQISYQTILGIVLSLIGGISFFLYGKQSYEFARATNFSPTQVLAIRFWLVELFCLVLFPGAPLSFITSYNLFLVVIIAITSLIIPIYFLMRGIFKIGPDKNAILCGLIPAVTYIIESIFFHRFNLIILLLNIATGVFIGLPYLKKALKKN